jgi:hypothetical protein
MVRVRVENSDQAQPEAFGCILCIFVFIGRDHISFVSGSLFTRIGYGQHTQHLPYLSLPPKQKTDTLFRVGSFTTEMDLAQNSGYEW